MKSEDALLKLIEKYGIRRALVLYGAAAVAAQRGWETLVSPDGYTRQGVWTWKRDLENAGIDPFTLEWGNYEKGVGKHFGGGIDRVKESVRQTQKKADARAARGRAAT